MKFGKQLEELSIPRYRGHYIQYKELKKAMKVWTGLEKEHSTVQEVTHWASGFLRLGPNPEVSPEMRLNELLRHEMKRISLFTERQEQGMSSQLEALEADCGRREGQPGDLSRRLDELGEQLVQLKTFAQLNFSGFRKISKKYDKWSETKARVTPWFMAEVMRSPFMRIDYEALLERVQRVAAALRPLLPLPPPAAAREQIGSGLDQVLCTGRDAVFVLDSKDTMKVRVLLAKHLRCRRQYSATEAGPVSRSRTTCVFLDSPTFAVYNAGVSGEGAPVPTTHLRHAGGDAAVLQQDPGQGVPPTEVLLATKDAAKLMRGEAVAPAPPGALPAEAVKAVEGLGKLATGPAATTALVAALRNVQKAGHKPVVQASYVRSIFQDEVGSFTVILDEEVRMARATEAFPKVPSGMEYLSQNIITVVSTASARSAEGTRWFQLVQDETNLVQVAGFAMSALATAHFFAKVHGLQEPRWYHSIMQSPEEEKEEPEEEKEEPEEEEAAGAGTGAGSATAEGTLPGRASASTALVGPAAAYPGAAVRGCRRLLHEFDTTPEAEEAEQAEQEATRLGSFLHTVDEGSVPADAGGLDAPLLGRTPPVREAPRHGGGGAFRVLLRAFGLASPVETEDMPVRTAIVAVQPKTLFSNERTFLEWMHFSTLLAAAGVVMMHGMSHVGTLALGRFIVLVAVFLAGWSLYTFSWRADALDKKEIVDYQDPVGPGAVIFAMLVGLLGTTLHALSVGGGDGVGS